MKTFLKWLGRGVLAIVGLVVLAIGVAYAVSSRKMNRDYEVPVTEFAIPADSASIARGERLARVWGCYNGCHGVEAEGELFVDDFLFGSITTPDLTRAAAELSPGELERAIRAGVRANGRGTVIMPSSSFFYIADEDLGAVLAFLKSLPPSEGPETSVRMGPMARVIISLGLFVPTALEIDRGESRPGPGDGSDPIRLGRYLVKTACTECHGLDLAGVSNPGFTTPSLSIAQAYALDDFKHLLSTGEPPGGRELDLMALVAEKRFSHLTESEVEAIHAFLLDEFGSEAAATAP